MLAIARGLTSILDYSLSISLAEFGLAVAILLAVMAWKRTRKKLREREDRWLLTQIALFIISGGVLLAFNLANTNVPQLQAPTIADSWVFYLGIVLFGFALMPLAPLCFITFYPKSKLPNRVVSLVQEGIDPALRAAAAFALAVIGMIDTVFLVNYTQALLGLWGSTTARFEFGLGILALSWLLGIIGTGVVIVSLLRNAKEKRSVTVSNVAFVMLLLPYLLLIGYDVLAHFGVYVL